VARDSGVRSIACSLGVVEWEFPTRHRA
jgi:hypothetical protein